ncbi:Hypothetical protein ERGA_CDS_04350 [Ehrlichia ruminantium str. Gardel]|nr:Hypothetical protein ERGA_CDS_04350 [Ehrlichia ruminantium str. Gardel]
MSHSFIEFKQINYYDINAIYTISFVTHINNFIPKYKRKIIITLLNTLINNITSCDFECNKQ